MSWDGPCSRASPRSSDVAVGPPSVPLPPTPVGEQRWAASLVEPHFWPHRVDIAADEITLLDVERHALRACTFLDGRNEFWRGSGCRLRLSGCDPESRSLEGGDRYIFHVGFCGSTLLTRLLDQPGAALLLREPRILTDVASYRAGLDAIADDDGRVDDALGVARRLLRRRWSSSEATVVKPSNWANNLIPALCADATTIRPLFLSMGRRAFVLAVLRGGSERLAFAARAALHFSAATLADAEQVACLLRRHVERTQTLIALAALAHRFQTQLFDDACKRSGWSDAHRLSLEILLADPQAAVVKAAAALDIDVPGSSSLANSSIRHSKNPGLIYSQEAQDAADARIEVTHGFRIDNAIEWCGT